MSHINQRELGMLWPLSGAHTRLSLPAITPVWPGVLSSVSPSLTTAGHHYQPILTVVLWHSTCQHGMKQAPWVTLFLSDIVVAIMSSMWHVRVTIFCAWHIVIVREEYSLSTIMAVSADEMYEPLHFPLRSRRASFPFSLAPASSRTSLSSEGSKSVVVSYKCKQTTNGFLTKKTKESYEGQFQRYPELKVNRQNCGRQQQSGQKPI